VIRGRGAERAPASLPSAPRKRLRLPVATRDFRRLDRRSHSMPAPLRLHNMRGDKIGNGNANCVGCGSQWDGKQPAPVGSFKPNAFGLYDMAGNVWEWVEDVWHDNYQGAPTNRSAWLQGGDSSGIRVARGGSWSLFPEYLRAAYRDRGTADGRSNQTGFRVARTLTP
jgi:formylglycine-generating enzyme required for sulfatase activity